MANVEASRIMSKVKKAVAPKWKAARGKAPQIKGGQLPGGIVGGIAQFSDYTLGETDKDKTPYLSLQFVVREPDQYSGVKQRLRYYFADTQYKSLAEVVDRLASDLQLMGCELESSDVDDWIPLLDSLKAEETAIRFNTRSGKTDVGKEWFTFDIQGLAEGYTPPEPEAHVEANGQPVAEDAGDDQPGDEDDWAPSVEEIYGYKPNPKSGLVEVEIVAVYSDKQRCDVKRTDDETKVYKNVAWDRLSDAP